MEHFLQSENTFNSHHTIRDNVSDYVYNTYANNEEGTVVESLESTVFEGTKDMFTETERKSLIQNHCREQKKDGIYAEAEFIIGEKYMKDL